MQPAKKYRSRAPIYCVVVAAITCVSCALSVQEITRRVNLTNIWQAAYTAGAVLPKPVSTTQYWHRSLNPKKLISVGFSRLQVLH